MVFKEFFREFFTALFEFFAAIVGADSDGRRQAVDDGICDFSGQGRDKYGR